MSRVTRTDLLVKLSAARERRAAGDYSGAADLLRAAIADAEAGFGPNAVELTPLLNELGVVGKYGGGFVAPTPPFGRARRYPTDRGRTRI